MSKFVVNFSPPVKIKSNQENETKTVLNYFMILAPFQKPTQVEFANIKIKETAVRYLTVINPHDKPKQLVLPSSNDAGICFDVYEFTLQPNSRHELSITWKPSQHGNMRQSIKIEQVDCNRKYDFIILGNCVDPSNKKIKGDLLKHSKSKHLSLLKKKIILNKTKVISSKTERIRLVGNPSKILESLHPETLQSPFRRQTYVVDKFEDKENIPNLKMNLLDSILDDSNHDFKHPGFKYQDNTFFDDFNTQNQNKNNIVMSDDSLDGSLKLIGSYNSPFKDFCLTPLKSTENLLTPFNATNKCNKFDKTNDNLAFTSFNTSPFKPIDASTAAKDRTPDERKPTSVSVNLYNKFEEITKNEVKENNATFNKDIITHSYITPPKTEQSFDIKQNQGWSSARITLHHSKLMSCKKPKRPSFVIRNSPIYKCSPKSAKMSKNRLKQYNIHSPQTKHLRNPKLDKCDQYLKCLANPELVYNINAEDPFLKMSQYYEAEWLDRQESHMIRWLNALLMPSDKLVDEEQSDDLEQAAVAWVEASKANQKNKPVEFATQKDLFAAQIYRQSPQQWSALRKAASNLLTSSNVAPVLSKLTVCIEKDLITVRDDRQIHLDLNLKKKITDLFKCYNPLWFRIGLEAIYGQIIHVKPGSNDLNGLGWFIRKHLFNNDFVKKKFTKTTVLQVNLPCYNIAMKKFILRKILMLIYFLDRAKEQQLIRHNPCLFKIDSPYKSSYDFLMGFCADMVIAHGDIMRRLRCIDYNLTHKQTHLDEVNYAVKSLNDLRDGTRITKVVEILFKGDQLSQKLRLPAISKLQKIHNVKLALTRICEHINIEGNISSRDIVNGHREKMLSLFWQIIYKYLTPRYNKAALKIQHWWRGNSLKLVILKRIRAKQTFKRHLAAAKIQAFVRGYLTRKNLPRIREELVQNRENLNVASTKIKHYLQKKLKLLTEERKRFIILKRTVIFVQRKFRSKIAMKRDRQQYIQVKQSALLIQKVYRGYAIRKNWSYIQNCLITDKLKRINAVNVIKRCLRKNLPPTEDELYLKKIIHVTLTIQRRFRANILMKIQMKEFLLLKQNVIIVQRRFRARQLMLSQKNHYLNLKKCTLKLQPVIRGYLVRKQWPALRTKLLANKMHLTASSNIIKKALRKNLPPTNDHIKFIELKTSVIILQRRFRALQAMKQQRAKYLNLKTTTLKLQSMARGYIVRKQWPTLRHDLQMQRMNLINSSNIIKKCLRRNLPVTEDRINFIKLKTAVVVLQRRFRANELMKSNREKYKRIKINTIKIQSIMRGYMTRKRWPALRNELQMQRMNLINSSNIIKKCLRKNLPLTKDRINFIKLKTAVVVLQRRFRANELMKSNRETYKRIKINTIKIQSIMRGYMIRKRWPALRNELQKNKMHLIMSSNMIKRVLRKNLPITEDRIKFLELKKSAIVLQRQFRAMQHMEQQRAQYLNLKTVTIKLQSIVRGYLVRKQWPSLQNNLRANRQRLIHSSNVIKKILRKNLPPSDCRLKFLQLRRAAIVIQKTFRANRETKEYQTLCKNVIVVQRRFRANISMRQQKQLYENTIAMTIRLQAYIRGYLMRKKWPETKCLLKANQKRLIAASNAIKKFLRKCLPPTQERLRYLELRKSVIILQARYRAIVAMKSAEREYLLFKSSVITLQRQYRAQRAMILQKRQYEHLKKSSILLQAYIRGYLTRKHWPELKNILEIQRKHKINVLQCKRLLVCKVLHFELNIEMRAAIQLRNWIKNVMLTRERLQKENIAASKIQAAVRGFLLRKKLPQLKIELHTRKQMHAATLIQALWRGYCIRKRYQCRRQTIKFPKKGALTLGTRHNDVINVLNKQKKNEYSYRELTTVFWNLETCTSLSKELCVKTADGMIVDYMFRFLLYSNQSQPSVEAREPAIRVLINLLKYHETSWHIWMRTVKADMVKDLIKVMKTCCGKISTYKLYCSIATWIWIALQDPEKKHYIKSIPTAIIDLRFMMDTLNKKYKARKVDKKNMALPSTRPAWSIGSKCQKCFDSDLYATAQICKLLNI